MSGRLVKSLAGLARRYSSDAHVADYKAKIGAREIVGYGYNGEATYMDREEFPFPAVRFRPEGPDTKELRQKEKGDWKNLSLADKKALYRATFCQTFAEMGSPDGEWKSVTGWCLVVFSLGLWAFMGIKTFVYSPPPITVEEERRQAQLKRMLAFRINPIEGISSKYDYEKDDWKK